MSLKSVLLLILSECRLVKPYHAHFNCSIGFYWTDLHSKNLSKKVSCFGRAFSSHAGISCLVRIIFLFIGHKQGPLFSQLYLFIYFYLFFFRVFFIAFKTDFWVYPVLAVLHWGYRLLFIAGLMISASTMYFSGEQLHYFVWGKICIVFFFCYLVLVFFINFSKR